MTILKSFRDKVPELGIVELDNNLPTDVLDLLMTAVVPAPLLSNRLKVMGDRPPSLLSGLKTITLIQILSCLHDKPPPDSPAVVWALEPRLRERR